MNRFHFTKITTGTYYVQREWSNLCAMVRRRPDNMWETAPAAYQNWEPVSAADRIANADWSVCPVAGAATTRLGACQAHWYYFDRHSIDWHPEHQGLNR